MVHNIFQGSSSKSIKADFLELRDVCLEKRNIHKEGKGEGQVEG